MESIRWLMFNNSVTHKMSRMKSSRQHSSKGRGAGSSGTWSPVVAPFQSPFWRIALCRLIEIAPSKFGRVQSSSVRGCLTLACFNVVRIVLRRLREHRLGVDKSPPWVSSKPPLPWACTMVWYDPAWTLAGSMSVIAWFRHSWSMEVWASTWTCRFAKPSILHGIRRRGQADLFARLVRPKGGTASPPTCDRHVWNGRYKGGLGAHPRGFRTRRCCWACRSR